MALKPGDYDFLSNMSAIWSIVIGALLATVGGLVGSQLERRLEMSRRQHDSALLFAEILSTLKILFDIAADSRKTGDPYGPITLRMLRSARREIDIYERNRENLLDLRDGELRAKIHTTILRLTMPLEGIFDSCQALDALAVQLKTTNLSERDRKEIEARMTSIRDNREAGFGFMMETAQTQLRDAVAELAAYGGGPSGEMINRVVGQST